MKLVRWLRFTWDLKKLPEASFETGPHYRIRPLQRDEAPAALQAVLASFSLDSSWNDALNGFRAPFETAVTALLEQKNPLGLVLTHGARIIGASLLDPAVDCPSHLFSGPCVTIEYRNRGLGTALLHASLLTLREAGLEKACGVIKQNLPAARYLYPKFNGRCTPCEGFLPRVE